MSPKFYDHIRREATPLQLDLVESFAQGKVSRAGFIKRGTVLGLSVPVMAAVVSACGGSSGTSTATPGSTPVTDTGATTGSGKTGGTIRVATQKPAGPLDPIGMQDLGTYGVIMQCFEYLCSLGDNGDIGPGLAESWTPNADGSEWTFKIRAGVMWQDGTPLTVDDVGATMDRLVAAGNSGLKGVIDAGSVTAADPATAVVKLLSPNGNFPYLVSVYNPQSVITPKAYATGTTLDQSKNGTGPWKLTKFDPATGASYVRNDAWWGGAIPLDAAEWQFFDDLGTMVNAMSGGSVDALVQFQVVGGEALLNDPNINVLALRTAAHRQVWMRCDKGQFADPQVRQALAYTFDRQQMVDTLFKGKADIGNDHVIAPLYPFFDDAAVPQRTKDIDKAKSLLAAAGKPSIKATLNVGKLQEIPDLAVLIQSGAKEAGFDLQINVESLDTFYGDQWCPGEPADPPCSGASELGVVDYGHRAVPDVYLNAALKSKGIWNSSQYASAEFDAAFTEYQKAVDVAGHKAACTKLETILNNDVPIGVPYFYNYLAAHSKKFGGLRVTALGQLFLDQASQA